MIDNEVNSGHGFFWEKNFILTVVKYHLHMKIAVISYKRLMLIT